MVDILFVRMRLISSTPSPAPERAFSLSAREELHMKHWKRRLKLLAPHC